MGTLLKAVALNPGASYVAGKFGNGINADGTTNNRGQIEGFTLSAGTNYTWTCWVKTNSSTSLQILFTWGGAFVAFAFGKLRVSYTGSGTLTATTGAVNDNLWHHIE